MNSREDGKTGSIDFVKLFAFYLIKNDTRSKDSRKKGALIALNFLTVFPAILYN